MGPRHTRIGDDRLGSIAQECRCGIDECRENVEGSQANIEVCIYYDTATHTRTLCPPLDTDGR